jgi:hypothetical protein
MESSYEANFMMQSICSKIYCCLTDEEILYPSWNRRLHIEDCTDGIWGKVACVPYTNQCAPCLYSDLFKMQMQRVFFF